MRHYSVTYCACAAAILDDVTLDPTLKKRSLMTIQNRLKMSFLTIQMDAVEL